METTMLNYINMLLIKYSKKKKQKKLKKINPNLIYFNIY